MATHPPTIDGANVYDIRDAIDAELEASSIPLVFTVKSASQSSTVWQLTIKEDDNSKSGLDESLEGSRAWWLKPSKGVADVLSVSPEDLQINLRFATVAPPGAEETLFVYAPRYLEALKKAWDDHAWSERCLNKMSTWVRANAFDQTFVADPRLFRSLREKQRAAFALPGWNLGLLWGPPGTGKTYTLGALLATRLLERPSARTLLLSSTNSATDQVLIAVDRALESLTQGNAAAASARRRCSRIGTHFNATLYDGREHLLPSTDVASIKKLTQLEASKPNAADAVAYAVWKREVEQIREAMRAASRAALGCSHLVAMTTTGAAFRLDDLRAVSPFDLLVLDEGSQISVVVAGCLTPLAKRTIVAGDPRQLEPIVKVATTSAEQWLGRSVFDCVSLDGPHVCRLNEQSRMAASICSVVGGTFYQGDLRVASDCIKDAAWLKYRQLSFLASIGDSAASRLVISGPHTYSTKYGGWIRFESAQVIVALAQDVAALHGTESVLIHSPFRAQRSLIKAILRAVGAPSIAVSTVHRAQGGERHTIIFDPVDGAGHFVRENERLLNVAISRAQARLVVAASEADLANPVLRQIVELIGLAGTRIAAHCPQLRQLVARDGFPAEFIGTVVALGDRRGRLERVHSDFVEIVDASTGLLKKFRTEIALPGYDGPWGGAPVGTELTSKQWSDFGGRGEKAYRHAVRELEERTQQERVRQGERFEFPMVPPSAGAGHGPGHGSGTVAAPSSHDSITPDSLLRARMAALANAPLRRGDRPRASTPVRAVRGVQRRLGRHVGVIINCEQNGGGWIRTRSGEHYAFAFVDLSPELKLKGVSDGLSVRFDTGTSSRGGSVGRAVNISE
jgi:hypothetical protein